MRSCNAQEIASISESRYIYTHKARFIAGTMKKGDSRRAIEIAKTRSQIYHASNKFDPVPHSGSLFLFGPLIAQLVDTSLRPECLERSSQQTVTHRSPWTNARR